MATDLTVANTILAQLGGRRFVLFTGAKDFIGSADALTMRLPRNEKGVDRVKITLTPADEYTLEAFKLRRRDGVPELESLDKREGLYCDNLAEVFERVTSLYTRL